MKKITKHRLGNDVIGNHSITHRPRSFDINRRSPQHLLGSVSHRHHLVIIESYSHHCRLIQNEPLTQFIDQGVSRS